MWSTLARRTLAAKSKRAQGRSRTGSPSTSTPPPSYHPPLPPSFTYPLHPIVHYKVSIASPAETWPSRRSQLVQALVLTSFPSSLPPSTSSSPPSPFFYQCAAMDHFPGSWGRPRNESVDAYATNPVYQGQNWEAKAFGLEGSHHGATQAVEHTQ